MAIFGERDSSIREQRRSSSSSSSSSSSIISSSSSNNIDATTSIEALNVELAEAEAAAVHERRRALDERRRAEEQFRASHARIETADQRVQEVRRRLLHQHRRQHGQAGLTGMAAVEQVFHFLTGMAAVEQVFHFLDGPADVLIAATACRRWRELACADSVWRAKFRREKLLERARLFEVALPLVPDGQGQGGAAAAAAVPPAAAAALVKDELAGVGLAFYARIFALEVV